MQPVDVGSGDPIVVIPGIQGRWEWGKFTVDALARRCRVITGSLPGEPGVPRADGQPGFDQFLPYVDRLFDESGIGRAVLCGISFGGLIALRYAARRPARVRALVLVSTPGPRWEPSARQAAYIRRPLLSSPAFVVGAAYRGWTELRTTLPSLDARLRFCAGWTLQLAKAPAMPWRMSQRARLALSDHSERDCDQIEVPTLVVAGEKTLDGVVSQADTMRYVHLIKDAQFRVLERTGHMGTITAPARFADIVGTFMENLPRS